MVTGCLTMKDRTYPMIPRYNIFKLHLWLLHTLYLVLRTFCGIYVCSQMGDESSRSQHVCEYFLQLDESTQTCTGGVVVLLLFEDLVAFFLSHHVLNHQGTVWVYGLCLRTGKNTSVKLHRKSLSGVMNKEPH